MKQREIDAIKNYVQAAIILESVKSVGGLNVDRQFENLERAEHALDACCSDHVADPYTPGLIGDKSA